MLIVGKNQICEDEFDTLDILALIQIKMHIF